MWFENLLGFKEINPLQVRENLTLEGDTIISKVNGQSYTCGKLEIPTLEKLRAAHSNLNFQGQVISISETVGDIQHIHLENENALIQAASQFNLLEMVGPHVTPEEGIGIYEYDKTQGPACAIACGAGTIYRNYFVQLKDQLGQTSTKQIDCLSELGAFFKNSESSLWKMQNGYALANEIGLNEISKQIRAMTEIEYEHLKGLLKIGIQTNTEVTAYKNKKLVTQAYCSALPIRYSQIAPEKWELFAKLILDSTYESTLYAGLNNYLSTGNNKVFLTLVGGGAFGNPLSWILDAIKRSITKFKNTPLDVQIVSYGKSNPRVKAFVEDLNQI